MTAPSPVRHGPSADVLAKAGEIVADHGSGLRPILIDTVTDPSTGVWSGMVPSATEAGVAYHVTHGGLLGWRCTHPWWREGETCAHILAAAYVAGDRLGFDREVLP